MRVVSISDVFLLNMLYFFFYLVLHHQFGSNQRTHEVVLFISGLMVVYTYCAAFMPVVQRKEFLGIWGFLTPFIYLAIYFLLDWAILTIFKGEGVRRPTLNIFYEHMRINCSKNDWLLLGAFLSIGLLFNLIILRSLS